MQVYYSQTSYTVLYHNGISQDFSVHYLSAFLFALLQLFRFMNFILLKGPDPDSTDQRPYQKTLLSQAVHK